MGNQWTRVDQSEGPTLELPPHASTRAIKAALGITGRRTVQTGTVFTVTVARDDERAAIADIIRAVKNLPFVG